MSKLMDICGLVDYNRETRQHDRTKSIYGSIILDEQSNYFEGITRTYDEKNAYLVFGTFNEEDGLHMYISNETMEQPKEVVSHANISKQYSAARQSLNYVRFDDSKMRIIIQDGEVVREVQNGEVSILRTKIDTMKENCNLVVENKQKKLK